MLPVIANLNSIMRKEMETCNLFIRDVMKKEMLTRLETVVNFAVRMKMKVRLYQRCALYPYCGTLN